MKELIQKFNKYGGWKLIREYHNAGVLLFACTEFLRLGGSQTALELLRASTQFKVQKRLYKKYKYVLENMDDSDILNMPHINSRQIWICWLQGVEYAPEIVQKCINSVRIHFSDYKINIITEENYQDYVSFPAYIQKKIDKGIITKTHFSDMLRLELLINKGGIWVDATVFMTENRLPQSVMEAELFMFQELKPGRDGHCMPMSSWFIIAKTNNLILYATRKLLYEYWEKNDQMIDYFLLHHFLNISREYYSDLWNAMPKYSNGDTHLLLLELFEMYNEERFSEMTRITGIHKLSYKFSVEQMNKKGTYYQKLFGLAGSKQS